MSKANEVNISFKVIINKEKTKVLFAEGSGDFADIMLSFLTMPLGTIVKLLQKHYGDQAPVFGSLTTLYNSLANLDSVHFWTEEGKLMLLNPRNPFDGECRKSKLNIDKAEPTKYFTCENWGCGHHFGYPRHSNISMHYDTSRCGCGGTINREINITKSEIENKDADGTGGFTLKTFSFLISDDLKMVPNVAGSFIQTLRKLGVAHTDGAEQRTVTIGLNETMDLLKGSLLSDTTLTDVILGKRNMDWPAIKFEPVNLIEKNETSSSKKMSLKVMVQKYTNKFLFAQAEDDFVDFLLSFLTIPLARVEWLLGGNSSLRNIDNLYNSAASLNNYIRTEGSENSLFEPKFPPMYLSDNQLFSLEELKAPALYYTRNYGRGTESLSYHKISNSSKVVTINDPKGKGTYVRGPGMYMVTDDLTVTSLCMTSSLSILNEMKIQLSDVEELEINIGLQEALNILKASLTSTCSLTNGLSYILLKQPKREPGP